MELEITNKDLINVAREVKLKYGFDVSDYAHSSLKRRLVRICEIYEFITIEDMIYELKSKQSFFDEWLKHVTVNTTELFRDPSVWKALREVMTNEFKNKESIKIWHAACSSGEEVFSMLIMLEELGLLSKAELFATDINEDVIEKAKQGTYPIRLLEMYNNNYIDGGGEKNFEDYITQEKRSFSINTDFLDKVSFQKFDLIQDQMVEKFDLILVRNVLIYFNQDLQDRLVQQFYDRLDSNGLLIVGSKETIAWCPISSHFETLNAEERIYRKISGKA